MFTPDKHIKEDSLTNLTDYSTHCPEGMQTFFVFVHFTDSSYCLLDNIFAADRAHALVAALSRFYDCAKYIQSFSLQQCES